MSALSLDNLIVAINAANVRLSGKVETLYPVGGQLVGNSNAFSQQAVNNAYRKMQNRMADMRFSGLQTDTVFSNVPVTGSSDPGTQVNINGVNYFDGSTTQVSPVLPANIISPYELSERPYSAGTNLALFTTMDQEMFSLPRVTKQTFNGRWLWKNNSIYMPGATVATDIALLYAQLLPDFVDNSPTASTRWFNQQIPIINTIDAFADYICREIMIARGDANAAAAFQLSADANVALLCGQDIASGSSILKASELMKMQDKYTPQAGKPGGKLVNRG
jgi:hypothetical protein